VTATGYTGGGGGGLVTSVFGRQGAVTAQSGDYTAAQVGADPAGSAASKMPIAGGTFTGATRPAVVNLTDAATILVDATAGNHFQVTINGDRTLGNPSGAIDGQKMIIEITQGAGGNHALALDTKYDLGAVTVVPSTTAGKRDYLGVVYDAASDKFSVVAFAAGY